MKVTISKGRFPVGESPSPSFGYALRNMSARKVTWEDYDLTISVPLRTEQGHSVIVHLSTVELDRLIETRDALQKEVSG